MIFAYASRDLDSDTLPRVPPWSASKRGEAPEDVAFLSGTALTHLHLVLGLAEVPQTLLRDRLALRAAEACVAREGRPERAGALRDALHLLRPGDLPGPAGEVYLAWQRVVARPISIKALHRAMPIRTTDQIAARLDARPGAGSCAPVTRAAHVVEAVLAAAPRAQTEAMILGDVALALALGWKHMVPLLAAGMPPRDLRKTGGALRLACHRAITASAIKAARMAPDLARRAADLTAAVPKLRAKGAGEAVEMFLTRDAVAPSALPLPDRAARRLCDRLVELGVVRELTGRDTFRLYGV